MKRTRLGGSACRSKFWVKEHLKTVFHKFACAKCLGMAIPAKSCKGTVVSIVNTGSSGVVILEGCFGRLGFVGDNEVKCTITSATETNKKLKKVLFGIKMALGKFKVKLQALALEGLHLCLLLKMSWLKKANAIVHAS